MNATTMAELRQTTAAGFSDQKMEQIRDLLFGEYRRLTEQRLHEIESRITSFETDVRDRLAAIEYRIGALALATESDRRVQLEELARAVGELGSRIGTMAKP